MFDGEPCTGIATTRRVERAIFGRILGTTLGLFVLVAGASVLAQYPSTLMYMSRGDRSEGLAAEPKSASAMALISALADVKPRETFNEWPEGLRLRFYFPKGESPPSIRVRQLRSLAGYYVLDNVTPPKPWAPGAVNEFPWKPDIIAKIYDYQVGAAKRPEIGKADWFAGLGVVVSLGRAAAPGDRQSLVIAPAAVHYSDQPLEVLNYLFTFRTNAAAKVSGDILNSANDRVFSALEYQVTAGSPFTVKWPITNQPDGWYRLVLDASLAGQLQMVVRFYHKRSLPVTK